jgi:hypothetical protein
VSKGSDSAMSDSAMNQDRNVILVLVNEGGKPCKAKSIEAD